MLIDPATSRDSQEEQLTFRAEEITVEHWRWVRELLRDVDRQDHCENLLSTWGQWQLVVRQFRQLEFSSMRKKEPLPSDLQWHEILVTGLISLGQRILKQMVRAGEPEEFRRLGFHLDGAEIQVKALRQNWEEWHGTVHVDRLAALQNSLSYLDAANSSH